MAVNTFFRVLNGAMKADISFDADNIPSTDEKAAIAGTSGTAVDGTNRLVDNADNRLLTAAQAAGVAAAPNAITGANPAADKAYVDAQIGAVSAGISWKDAVDHSIDYIKTDTGAPSGTPNTGDKLLNTADATLFQESGGSWDVGTAVSSGDRFIFKDTGSGSGVVGGNTTGTPDNSLREYNGSTFDVDTAEQGDAVCVLDESSSGRKYVFDSTNWVFLENIQVHNDLGSLQGGNGSTEYFHMTQSEDEALNAATSLSSTNPPQTLDDRDKVPTKYTFLFLGGFAANQTDIEVFEQGGVTQRVELPPAGSIVKTVLQSSDDRTAGTLTAEPTLDGTKVTANDLDLLLDGSTVNDDSAQVAPGTTNLTFTAGQQLGVRLTSDASWANSNGDIQIDIYVVFDD